MKLLTSRISWGVLLIAGGVLLLLQNLRILPEQASIWTIIFGAFGIYFLAIFFASASHWWTAFPAFGFLALALTITIAEMTSFNDEWAGVAFLGLIGMSFYAIYLRNREHWWPLIPGGVLLSLAGVVLVTTVSTGFESLVPTVLFGGFALTFLLLYLAPAKANRAGWAIWPAAGLLLLALLTSVAAYDLAGFILPVILIIVGIAILLRSFRSK